MSVLSPGRVAGPTSPFRRDLRVDSSSCGANLRFSRPAGFVSWWAGWGEAEGGDSEVGEGSGVGSAAGPALRCSLKVVSMGTGAKRLRAGAGSVMVSVVNWQGQQIDGSRSRRCWCLVFGEGGCGEKGDDGCSCTLWLGQTERGRLKMRQCWVGQGTRQLAKGPIEATKCEMLL